MVSAKTASKTHIFAPLRSCASCQKRGSLLATSRCSAECVAWRCSATSLWNTRQASCGTSPQIRTPRYSWWLVGELQRIINIWLLLSVPTREKAEMLRYVSVVWGIFLSCLLVACVILWQHIIVAVHFSPLIVSQDGVSGSRCFRC